MLPLPPTLYRAKTVRVIRPSILSVTVDLGFGVSVVRTVRIDGAPENEIPLKFRDSAMHCATVLLGGKRLVIRYHDTESEKVQHAKVYLDEKVFGNPTGFGHVAGDLDSRLDVGAYLTSLIPLHFNIDLVRKMLNGPE
jgi:hypothetical protein